MNLQTGRVSAGDHAEKNKPLERQQQVQGEIDSLNATVDLLCGLASNLDGRLQAVLRTQPPNDAESSPEPVLVPMAETVRRITHNARSVAAVLESIIERLEI